MRPLHRILCFCLFLLILATACRKKEALAPDVIARVGERTITLDDFKHYLQRNAGADLAQIAPQAVSALLDQYLEEALLSEYAGARGVEISAERIAAAVRSDAGSTVMDKRDEMRRAELIRRIESKLPMPGDDQVRAYYDQHAQEFNLPERVRARQILVRDRDTAREVLAKLRKGDGFEEVSSQYSKAANARNGGDIGWIERGQVPKKFEDILFALAPGEVSEVAETDNTFHIFKVEAYAPAGAVSFEEARDTIRAKIREDALDAEISRMLTQARKDIPTRVLRRRLPFNYSGAFPVAVDE